MKMRVLIACDRNSYPNPFVRVLADSLLEMGVDVACSLDEFWHSWESYDIIHLQWPNLLVEGIDTIEHLKSHLQLIKNSGKPLIITCHNIEPHYSNEKTVKEAYDVVYNLVDCFIHMGSYSYDLFKKKYPLAKHIIIPHHVYDRLYKVLPSKEDAIKHLRLNSKFKYVLCFGAFRHDDERDIAVKASDIMAEYCGKVLAPSFSTYKLYKNIFRTIDEYIRDLRYRLKHRNIVISKGFVPDADLPYYYAVADIALIHRKQILNSGNLPMAFYMGKVVIGPNVGNVGTILQETGNPTFDVHNIESLKDCINKAMLLNQQGKGEENKKYAVSNFLSNKVAEKHIELYKTLIKVQ